jgi:hypothetical protein
MCRGLRRDDDGLAISFYFFSGQCAPIFHIFHRNTGEIQ